MFGLTDQENGKWMNRLSQTQEFRKPPRRKFLHLALGVWFFVSTSMGVTKPALGEPISGTALAIWGATQGLSLIFRAMKQGGDPTGELIAQNREMLRVLLSDSIKHKLLLEQSLVNDEVLHASIQNGAILVEALHYRVDVLGEIMKAQLEEINDLPKIIREDITSLLDQHRERRLRGVVDAIDIYIRQLGDGATPKDNLQHHWTDYLQLRNALILHHRGLTALIMPELYVFEERVLRSMEAIPGEKERYRSAYTSRIDYELSGNYEDSLYAKFLLIEQQIHASQMMVDRLRAGIENGMNSQRKIIGEITALVEQVDEARKIGEKHVLREVNFEQDRDFVIQELKKLNVSLMGVVYEKLDSLDGLHGRLEKLTQQYQMEAREIRKGHDRMAYKIGTVEKLRAISDMYYAALDALVRFSEYIDHGVPLSFRRAFLERLDYGIGLGGRGL